MTEADLGLVILGLTAPAAYMSMFLPSPSTGYDKTSGTIASGPQSLRILRRDELIGTAVSLAVAAGVSLIAAQKLGAKAAWIFIGAAVILALFLFEYETSLRAGTADAGAAS
ncbi:MAG: hypothetical protein M0010_15285 [Actinomycetota bacterium]|jgi:hypothetical protein|nr:hypothetical protein [Actinomycetota bacterium]